MLIRLLKGKCINGVDYGPGYAEDVVDVPEKIARHYLQVGSAVLVVEQVLPPVPTLSAASFAVESRDPQPSARRGRKS